LDPVAGGDTGPGTSIVGIEGESKPFALPENLEPRGPKRPRGSEDGPG